MAGCARHFSYLSWILRRALWALSLFSQMENLKIKVALPLSNRILNIWPSLVSTFSFVYSTAKTYVSSLTGHPLCGVCWFECMHVEMQVHMHVYALSVRPQVFPGLLSSYFIKWDSGQSRLLLRETLCQKTKKKKLSKCLLSYALKMLSWFTIKYLLLPRTEPFLTTELYPSTKIFLIFSG